MFLEDGVKLESETPDTNGASRTRWTTQPEIELDPKLVDRMRPDVQARRTKYVRYVAAVCAGCALLGVVALVKMMLQ